MNNQLPPLKAEITEDDLIRHYTLEESFRMVYLPIILTKSAMEYANFARSICVEKRLSFNRQCREIRWALDEYERRNTYHYRIIHGEELQEKVEEFTDLADHSLQTLWYTIKNQLAKQFPTVGNYDLLANIYMAVILLDYVCKLECAISRDIRRRTGKPFTARIPKECIILRRALMAIAGAYKMDNSDTLRTAIIALALKADKMVHVVRNQ